MELWHSIVTVTSCSVRKNLKKGYNSDREDSYEQPEIRAPAWKARKLKKYQMKVKVDSYINMHDLFCLYFLVILTPETAVDVLFKCSVIKSGKLQKHVAPTL